MKAVILNSGTGSRMGFLTEDKPKCLVKLTDENTILYRQIEILKDQGIDHFVITIGPFNNLIPDYVNRHFPDISVVFVRNKDFATTNYIYSMYLADKFLRDDILLLHGDLVFSRQVAENLIYCTEKDVVIVDTTIQLPVKDFKGRIENERIVEIGVSLPAQRGTVFLLPFYKLSEHFMNLWLNQIEKFVVKGDVSVYAEEAFNSIADNMELKALDISGKFCMEVDTLQDLELARKSIDG